MGDKQIAFKVDDERYAALTEEAALKGQTLAGLVRQIVYEYIHAKEAH